MPLGLGNIFNGLFKQYGHTVILLLRFIDIAMLIGAAWVSHYFWLRQFVIDQDYRIVVVSGYFGGHHLFRNRPGLPSLAE